MDRLGIIGPMGDGSRSKIHQPLFRRALGRRREATSRHPRLAARPASVRKRNRAAARQRHEVEIKKMPAPSQDALAIQVRAAKTDRDRKIHRAIGRAFSLHAEPQSRRGSQSSHPKRGNFVSGESKTKNLTR